jgi:hypothetical protein
VRTRKECVPTNWVLMLSIHRLRKVIRPSKQANPGKLRRLGCPGVPRLQAVPRVTVVPRRLCLVPDKYYCPDEAATIGS